MPEPLLPLLVEADVLQDKLDSPNLLVVDLTKPETYAKGHIPGAVYLDYPLIVRMARPVGGLLPDESQLSIVLSRMGLTAETHVVAYDDEGGGKAARLLWTLEAIGHTHYSLLNGGLHVWANEDHPLEQQARTPQPSQYEAQVQPNRQAVVGRQFILDHLNDDKLALLDVRSPAEFTGEKLYAARGGHIPGAINIEWTEFMDQSHNLRLKGIAELRNMLEEKGFTPDKTVVAYCQTHHRSAHTWFVLKYLGYPEARGYEGSWSDWGNREETPIEV
ncbi:MAG: sulfurtransferase [Gammaproteobacteria bacterium]|nr:sulfurtransferase [Gammaproteobacteria bacterium]MCW8841347.1 sulfurtransferase [Gammaproteobacteria bacterium]MCW8928055.1 sulfurtransferase [Gammaproteobacteria bacterium]MCW8958942.1 sulfurtransferase [Gammaproteobacteria bacterium]MCW8973448.1 sulfurtransferase [Gammaproteobacteria bacterium]